MRILYVSSESPLFPAGGIATYLGFMAEAMQAAGHETYLFGWSDVRRAPRPLGCAPFKPENVHIEACDPEVVRRNVSVASMDLRRADWLARAIAARVREWDIDVVEATDYQAPALAFFQSAQTRRGNDRLLCVTYNHGFIGDFYEADQLAINGDVAQDLLCERQQCRISDLVIAPSNAARRRLQGYGIRRDVEVVREPYRFSAARHINAVRHDLTYIGRISISKGIDKLVHFANAIHPVHPLRQVRLLGRLCNTPFRQSDVKEYLAERLDPQLRATLSLSGFLPRQTALDLLEPGSICPSLGSAETFSYACIESIDRGLLPVVRQETPMEEFLPDTLRHHALDPEMRSVREMQRKFEALRDDGPAVLREVQDHCRSALDPAAIAQTTGDLYDRKLREKRGRQVVPVARPARLEDVTVLIPAHAPGPEFAETVDSLLWQSVGAPRVIICDDGTPEDQREWFEYAHALLPDCRIIRQPNTRLLGARNTLIEACQTDLALFLDADDLLGHRAIEALLEAWNTCPRRPDAVIPQRQNFGESNEMVLRTYLEDHLHILENDFRMTALIRTSALRDIGFDATRRNGEADDWDFWLRFTGRGHVGVLLPETEFFYRFRHGSMSWPWSQGQTVGTQSMIRNAVLDMCRRDPGQVPQLAHALYAARTRPQR